MRYLYKLLFVMIGSWSFLSCEKDEDRVTFSGGTPPVLSVSSDADLVLEKPKAGYQSIQFQWTNPEYEFSNGVNTHDVNYTLEIDTLGSDFSNPKMVSLSVPRELMTTFTVRELNNALAGLELTDGVPHNFQFRIKSTLASTNVVPLYSNVIDMTITTYLDVVFPVPDKLFITGAATPGGWMGDNAPELDAQEFEKVNAYTFVLEALPIIGGQGYLFVPVYGNWSNKYGFAGTGLSNNPISDSFTEGGNDFISPPTKTYKITVNFKTGKYTFE